MGRYTTIQAFADNSGSMRAVPYDQAVGAFASGAAPAAARGPVVTEKVDNPYGSTAGAGSGEFHVYRHARAREMARWKEMHATEAEMKAEEEFQRKVAEDTRVEAEKTEKRRRKREREKNAKKRKKNMKLGGVGLGVESNNSQDCENGDDEFDYTPIAASELKASSDDTAAADLPDSNCDSGKVGDSDEKTGGVNTQPKEPLVFANDGSFLEQSKMLLKKANE
ncbi:hypothetical protein ACHAWO_007892 [Cyclotella atomus]|jgi:hypothetical protein|uniref:Uncharacterized protein n=1 Tax=Cyclotella atomus TaxID=382360 RepID=A0ABD3NH58_9STRA